MRCGVGHRHGLDPELLWLWCRLTAAALIQPLACELPYVACVALNKQIYTYTHTHTHIYSSEPYPISLATPLNEIPVLNQTSGQFQQISPCELLEKITQASNTQALQIHLNHNSPRKLPMCP